MKKHLMFAAIVAGLMISCGPKEELTYSGSSTIGMNILPEAVRLFVKKTGLKFNRIQNPGSGKGVADMLDGKYLVGGASRKLNQDEINKGAIATAIGYDAISVIVNKANPINSLTKEQLKGIFTGKIKNWKEVGGNDAPIKPNTEILGEKRATMLEFQEMIMDKEPYGKGFLEIDYPRDQVPAVEKDPNGICSPSLSFANDRVKVLAVNNIHPTKENIKNGSYLISRPLLLITKGPHKGSAKKFIDFMLSPEGQTIVGQKFVPAN
jgi:phosphate transport system substrate-binding protein